MTDKCGVPVPNDPEDYQDFMLRLYDLIDDAREIKASVVAVQLLEQARLILIEEFEEKHPGYGKGRAIWK